MLKQSSSEDNVKNNVADNDTNEKDVDRSVDEEPKPESRQDSLTKLNLGQQDKFLTRWLFINCTILVEKTLWNTIKYT